MGNCFRDAKNLSEPMEIKKLYPILETITSSEDIRKVYKFNPKVIGHIINYFNNYNRTWALWYSSYCYTDIKFWQKICN